VPHPRSTLNALAAALVFGACLLASIHPAGSLAATSARRPVHKRSHAMPPTEVTLTPAAIGGPGAEVTMPPVGLSLEYPVMANDLGTGTCPAPALITELQRLGSPPLSLAGDSQDMTAPSGVLGAPPASWEAGTLYQLPADFWSQLHCLLTATGDPLTVGLNAKSGELAWAAQMVAGAQSAATSGLDFSIGNEPDLYNLPNYAALGKPQPGEEAAAVNLYLAVAGYLQQALAGAPLIGPELAIPAKWRNELPQVIAQLHEQTVGVHLYPLSACGSPKAVTIAGLLSAHAADAPASLGWVVADAAAVQAPAILSEANSASCGGVAGVSDSPASAVWAVRFVLDALKTGFREVRFHLSGNAYDPFVVRGQEVIERPLESALVALNQWLPVGSSLHTVPGVRGLVATGVSGASGTTLLILDNESTRSRAVVLRGADSVRIQALGASRAGLQAAQLSSARGRIAISVAPNSIVAVSPAA
jgi:hypothetical protein